MADEDPVIGDPPPRRNVLFSNAVYDKLKFVAQVVLPALALFYISLAPLWGFPKQEEVAGTIVAFDLLLGSVLGISNRMYKRDDNLYAGTIVYDGIDGPDPKVALLPKDEWKTYQDRDQVTFRIKRRN